MTNYNNLKLEQNTNGVLVITINRESKLNALNIETIAEIKMAIEKVYTDNSIKGVIITGAGAKAFVAGADISEIAQLNAEQGKTFAKNGQAVFKMIEDCPKPVVAAVNGFALGGGCELAMSCHIRIAASNAKFGQPEVNLGIIPGYGGTQRLAQLIGKGKAMELMMTADIIDAQQALQLGLVNHIAEADQLTNKCDEIMHKILGKAPIAIAHVIKCVNDAFDHNKNGYNTEAQSFGECCTSNDFKEGTSAFLEKRKADFKGN